MKQFFRAAVQFCIYRVDYTIVTMITDRQLLWVCGNAPDETPDLSARLATDGVFPVFDLCTALQQIQTAGFDCVFLSCAAGTWNVENVLDQIQSVNSRIPVVMQSDDLTTPDAVRLARLGAYQCFGREFDLDHLMEVLYEAMAESRVRESDSDRDQIAREPWKRFLVGESAAIRKIAQVIRLIGNRRCTVLITGETGTGKEMAARALHMASSRAHL